MSNSSLVQIPDTWRSSSGLAALASLGIHGLLFALLPFVSLDSPAEQLPENVPVVALTPEEQSRLPQGIPPINQATIPSTGITQGDLPPLPSSGQVFQSDNLPPLPPTPSFLPPPPPINTPTYQYPISNSLPPSQIPTVPVPLPPPPQNSSSISQYPIEQLPQPQQNQNTKSQQTPLPPNPPVKSNLPSTTGLKPGDFSPPNTNQSQNQVAINNSNSQQTQRLAPSTVPERTKQELVARRNAISAQRSSNKSENQDSQRLAAALKRRQQLSSTTPDTNQRLAAVLQRRQQASSTTPDPNQRLAAVLQRRQQQPNAASGGGISRATRQTIAQVDAFKQQQERTLQDFPNIVLKPPIRQTIKTCNKQLDGDIAILAAVVSPAGKIISGPDLLSKNSSPSVQRAAKRFVNSYQFAKSDNRVNQSFSLKFTYDAKSCPVTKK